MSRDNERDFNISKVTTTTTESVACLCDR